MRTLDFDRVKIRQAMNALEALGFDAAGLADTAGRMARARAALEAQTAALLGAHAVLSRFGHVEVETAGFASAPAETRLRALAAILKCVSGRAYGPRMDGLAALDAALADGTLGRGRTLNGVKFSLSRGRLLAVREVAAAQKSRPLRLAPGEAGTWDGRFDVRLRLQARTPISMCGRLGPRGSLCWRRQALPCRLRPGPLSQRCQRYGRVRRWFPCLIWGHSTLR